MIPRTAHKAFLLDKYDKYVLPLSSLANSVKHYEKLKEVRNYFDCESIRSHKTILNDLPSHFNNIIGMSLLMDLAIQAFSSITYYRNIKTPLSDHSVQEEYD